MRGFTVGEARWAVGGLGLAVLAAAVSCTEPPERSALPKAEVDRPIVDLGEILLDGEDVSLRGRSIIRNRGNAPLLLYSVNVSCGCTLVDAPPDRIEPGDHAIFSFRVRPKMIGGPQSSLITIATNDASAPALTISPRWLESRALHFTPDSIDFGRFDPGGSRSASIIVTGPSHLVSGPLDLTSTHRGLECRWAEEPRSAGSDSSSRAFEAVLSVLKASDRSESVIQVSRGGIVMASIPVRWNAEPIVGVHPRALYHAGAQPGASVTSRIVFRSKDRAEITLLRVDGETVPYEVEADKQGDEYSSVISFVATAMESVGVRKYEVRLTYSTAGGRVDDHVLPMVIVTK